MSVRTALYSIALALQSLVSSVGMARTQVPETYFTGAQLALAKAIAGGDATKVGELLQAMDPRELNRPAKDGMTPLFFALQSAYGEKPKQLHIITQLVKAGADPLQRVDNLGTVLGVSLRARSPLYVKALLDGGVSVDTVEGSTPILFEVVNEHAAQTLKLLLDRGATIDKADSLGNTALMRSLMSMQLDQTVYLLDRGAGASFVNINGVSFANQLQFQISRQQDGSPAQRKLIEIRDRIVAMGVAWLPASREQEQERMRSRGETPGKPRPVAPSRR